MATRKLRIVKCEKVFQGTGANGEYTIYEVDAVDANTGVVINVPLRSFEHLELDEVADFTVVKYEKSGKPTTYTLSKAGKGKGGGNALGPKLDKLRERVDLIEQNVDMIRRAVAALEEVIKHSQIAHPVAAGGSIHTQTPSLGGGPQTSDDIPFAHDGFPSYSERRNHDPRWYQE